MKEPNGDAPSDPAKAGRPSGVAAAAQTYGANAGAACLSLINVLVVARALGPAGRGDVAFVVAVVTFTGILATFGIQEANANIAGREPDLRAALATNSVLFALGFGAVAAVAIVVLTRLVPAVGGDVERGWLLFALAAIPVVVLKSYLQFLAQADYRFTATNLAWVAGPLTTSVGNGAMALAGVLSVGSATVAWVAGQTIGTILLVADVHRRSGFGRPDPTLARRSVRFGVQTHVGRSLTLGNYRIDQWFVGAMAGSRELGFYSVAVAWVEALYYIPGVLSLVQRPDIVRATQEEAAWRAARVFRTALLVSGAAAAVLALLAPLLCTVVYGAEFAASVDDLRILSLAAFGIVAMEILGSTLVGQRRPLLATAPIAAAFVFTIVLDILLIPPFGGAGAAAATSVAWTVGGFAVVAVFTRSMGSQGSDLIPRSDDGRWLWGKARGVVSGVLVGRSRGAS